jgi:hypothetical protein
MRTFSILLLVVLLVGCNTLNVKTKDVTAKGSGMGRGAIELTVSPTGEVTGLGCFDATTDWLSLRIIPEIVRGAISIFFGRPDPGGAGADGPSSIGGCDALFEGAGVE